MEEDKPYSNREIREKWHDTANSLDELKGLVTLTNGRVRWLEKMVWLSIGFCACVTLLIIPVLLQSVHLTH